MVEIAFQGLIDLAFQLEKPGQLGARFGLDFVPVAAGVSPFGRRNTRPSQRLGQEKQAVLDILYDAHEEVTFSHKGLDRFGVFRGLVAFSDSRDLSAGQIADDPVPVVPGIVQDGRIHVVRLIYVLVPQAPIEGGEETILRPAQKGEVVRFRQQIIGKSVWHVAAEDLQFLLLGPNQIPGDSLVALDPMALNALDPPSAPAPEDGPKRGAGRTRDMDENVHFAVFHSAWVGVGGAQDFICNRKADRSAIRRWYFEWRPLLNPWFELFLTEPSLERPPTPGNPALVGPSLHSTGNAGIVASAFDLVDFLEFLERAAKASDG
ncbi:MAG: hypothetical protein OEM59_08435, partial [Rhodospirillales bacterium]|nr:hypothetical protein [Rhodospirillales bacterium]